MGIITTHNDRGKSPKAYTPPPKALKLIETMLDPVHRMAHVKRICEVAGVSRKYYYLCFDNEQFVDFYNKACLSALKQHTAQLINIGIREARKGGQAGSAYWKTLLEINGTYKQKFSVEEKSDRTIRVVFGSEEDDEDDSRIEGDGIIEIGAELVDDEYVFEEDQDEE